MRNRATTRRSRARSETGASLIEFAIVVPVLVLLVFGVIEYGLLFSQASDISDAARRGARMGVATGTEPTKDYDILRALKSGGYLPGSGPTTRVIIFRAQNSETQPPEACLHGSVSGLCNVYTGSQITAGKGTIEGLQNAWSPNSRVAGQDFLGVSVTGQHRWLTGLFGKTRTVSDTVVMQIEPANLIDELVPGRMDVATPPPPPSNGGGGRGDGDDGDDRDGGDWGEDPPDSGCEEPTPECPLPDCCSSGPGKGSGGSDDGGSSPPSDPPDSGGGEDSGGKSGTGNAF